MSYKAVYAYAWDLAETGVERAAGEFKDFGLDTVTIAGSYHAGKFMRPQGKAGKVYFPDDGTVYFRSTASNIADFDINAQNDIFRWNFNTADDFIL